MRLRGIRPRPRLSARRHGLPCRRDILPGVFQCRASVREGDAEDVAVAEYRGRGGKHLVVGFDGLEFGETLFVRV